MVELLALALAFGASSMGLFLAMLMAGLVSRRAIVDQRSTTEALARELGLEVHGTDVLVGRYDDHDVHQYAISDGIRGPSTETRVVVRGGLPRGLALDARALWSALGGIDVPGELPLDQRLRRGLVARAVDVAATRELLGDQGVIEAFLAIWRGGARAELRDDRVILVRRHVHAKGRREALNAAVRLAVALEVAVRAPWAEVAARRGLTIAPGGDVLSGVVRGVALKVRWIEGEPGQTEVTARFHPALPWGTALRTGSGPTVSLGDPVLDGMIRVVTPEPQALAARVVRDDVRGALLEVVHGHPGSEVVDDTIRLVAPGRLRGTLDAEVGLVLTLAHALARPLENAV